MGSIVLAKIETNEKKEEKETLLPVRSVQTRRLEKRFLGEVNRRVVRTRCWDLAR